VAESEDIGGVKRELIRAHISYIAIFVIVFSVAGFLIFMMLSNIKEKTAEIVVVRGQLQLFLDKEIRLKNMQLTLLVNYRISEYEAKYYSIIYDDFAIQYSIPWEIYPTIVRIESNFDPTAKSDKGAGGLTQLMPNTAKAVAKRLGIKFVPGETLWNDIHNMIIGFTYLSDGILENGLEHGVKRYLGGPGYSKTEKKKGDMYSYIGRYRTSVKEEFDRNQFIYMGVSSNIFMVDGDSVDVKPIPSKVDSDFANNNPLYPVVLKDDKNE
jgi:soluble lytic murein transglycosylase